MVDLVGFGALNLDIVYEVDDLSHIVIDGKPCEAGSERFCDAEQFADIKRQLDKHGKYRGQSAGGSAANTAVAMTRLGFSAGYIGQVGTDKTGDFLLESMAGVDVSRVRRGGETGVTVVLLDPDGERTIIVLPNCNDELSSVDVDADYAVNAKYVHLTSFAGEKPTAAQIDLVEKISGDVKISFDPGEIHTQKGLVKMMPIFKKSSLVFITNREIRLLTGEDYVDGTHEILAYGPEIVVCKLGKIGSYILTVEQEFGVPTRAIEPIDKTGAGDVYAAGFIGSLLKELPVQKCGQVASQAAALSITGWGRESYPDESLFKKEI